MRQMVQFLNILPSLSMMSPSQVSLILEICLDEIESQFKIFTFGPRMIVHSLVVLQLIDAGFILELPHLESQILLSQ